MNRTKLFVALLPLCFSLRLGASNANLTDSAHVSLETPDQGFASMPSLMVGRTNRAYLKFNLSTLPDRTPASRVASATLYLYVDKLDRAGSIEVRRIGAAWNEDDLTAASAPVLGDVEVDQVSLTSARRLVRIDVTKAVKSWLGSSNNGLALAATSDLEVSFGNKASTHPPSLDIVLFGPDGAPGAKGADGATGPAGPKG